eukprot:TRINITY_DN4539_c0_g1_i1.p3 TRINITY_DN4539_c0_g1~~TRINITY_DN4539_c0_g1_i1.p3  ORF type:complete len:110 (-),score=20.17 TRINITY_DN4539_c0_g1_i1:81-410(-)
MIGGPFGSTWTSPRARTRCCGGTPWPCGRSPSTRRCPFLLTGGRGGVHVWHGRVYEELDKNALIVPLKRMRGHTTAASLGVMDLAWHPRLPWLFSAGADGVIRMYGDVE